MKTLTSTTFLVLLSYMLYGQDLTGQWNGTLNVQGNEFRIVFHIVKTDNQYTVTMDSQIRTRAGFQYQSLILILPT